MMTTTTRNFLAACDEITTLAFPHLLKVRVGNFWGVFSEEKAELVLPIHYMGIRWMIGDFYEVQTIKDKRGIFSCKKQELVVPALYDSVRRAKKRGFFVVSQNNKPPRTFSTRKGRFA